MYLLDMLDEAIFPLRYYPMIEAVVSVSWQ